VTLGKGFPWISSAAIHLVAGTLVILMAVQAPPPGPRSVKMHLVAGGQSAAPGTKAATPAWVPGSTPEGAGLIEPPLPGWSDPHSPVAAPARSAAVPVSLEDLLAGSGPDESAEPAVSGWVSPGGEGYQMPPLPPPGLTPPQGARWTLVVSVPGSGGYPTAVEGLDSGHPDLDRWLEGQLRSITFPAGLDGRDHELRWVLRLESGRPQ